MTLKASTAVLKYFHILLESNVILILIITGFYINSDMKQIWILLLTALILEVNLAVPILQPAQLKSYMFSS